MYYDYNSYSTLNQKYNNSYGRNQTNNSSSSLINKLNNISQNNKIKGSNFFGSNYDRNVLNVDSQFTTLNPTNYFNQNFSQKQTKYSSPYLKDSNISKSQIYLTKTSDYKMNDYYNNQREKNYFSSITKDNENKNNNTNNSNFDQITNQITTSKIGLQNLGNTCYMNTTLQILIHTVNFINRFYQEQNRIETRTPISKKLYEFILQFIKTSYAISPKEFKTTFSHRHRQFSGNDQYDTQEFCRILLEDINSELNKVKGSVRYKELDTKNKSKIQCDNEYNELFKSRENSIIVDTFYGQIINIFTCKCDYETFSFQKILDLPLLIPKNSNNTIELVDLIDLYFEGEDIKFETKCEKCNKKTIHRKEIFFSRPPEILILSLQRLNNRTKRKNNVPIHFKEVLNLKNFIDKDCGNRTGSSYVLYGIANHTGTIDYGHYYAYIKIGANWFEFNDSIVKQMGKIENVSSNAYVLFYRRNDV